MQFSKTKKRLDVNIKNGNLLIINLIIEECSVTHIRIYTSCIYEYVSRSCRGLEIKS